MDVEVMYTAECPNAGPVMSYLAGRERVVLTTTEVGPEAPVPPEFAGSPTVLIDGTNPFGGEHVEAPACAVHPPTVAEIERTLQRLDARSTGGSAT